nr:stress response protein NST1-like [Leptinotarsa decemlineata]
MSYVNKKTRVFRQLPEDAEVIHVRSEGRMKDYPSATDARAWSDNVEERRQHILEYQAKNKGPCLEKIIPLDVLINAIVANKNMQIRKLEKRIAYLERLLDIYSQLDLTEDQKKQFDELKNQLEKAQAELDSLRSDKDELETIYERRKRKGEEHPTSKPKKIGKKDSRKPSKQKEEEEPEEKRIQRKKKIRTPAKEIPPSSGEEEVPAAKRYRGKRSSSEPKTNQ